jgi:cytoskeletal protein RodZ
MAAQPSRTPLGVGSALRRARGIRGITLEEAARDTKLRVEQLRSLEDEEFDVLGGEVYARATLRTYAGYLGLNQDKVVGAYTRQADDPEPPPPPVKAGRVERALAAARVRDNQRFLLGAAAVVLLVLIVTGFVSKRSSPVAASLPTDSASIGVGVGSELELVLTARGPIDVEITADGETQTFAMKVDESRSFTARSSLDVHVSDGGAVDVVVDGLEIGIPTSLGTPWSQTYSPGGSTGVVSSASP